MYQTALKSSQFPLEIVTILKTAVPDLLIQSHTQSSGVEPSSKRAFYEGKHEHWEELAM